MKKTNLEIRVMALNLLNEFAEKSVHYEMSHFTQFVGADIFKVDGSIKKKYSHDKLKFNGVLEDGTHYDFYYWFENRQSFDMHMKICVNGGSYDVTPSTAFCMYQEKTTELFKIEKGVIIESKRERHDFSIRYSVDEILKANEGVKAAEEAYKKACSLVPYEFHDVLYIGRIH